MLNCLSQLLHQVARLQQPKNPVCVGLIHYDTHTTIRNILLYVIVLFVAITELHTILLGLN